MWVDTLIDACALYRRADHLAQVLLCVGPTATDADKQQLSGLAVALAQILGQQTHTRRGNMRVAALLRLC